MSAESVANFGTRPTDWQTVLEPAAVRLLLDHRMRRLLEPMMLEAHSVKRLSEILGEDLNRVHHRVQRLQRAGLIRVAQLETRRGRAIKHYRASAKGFFVPFTATTTDGLEGFLVEQGAPVFAHFSRLLARAGSTMIRDINEVGFRLYDAGGFVNTDFTPRGQGFDLFQGMLAEDAPAIMSSFTPVQLSREDAKALQLEMLNLLGKYAGRGGAENYLIHLGMAPGDFSSDD